MRDPQDFTPADIQCLRKALGMNVRAFAAALGVTERAVNRWESPGTTVRRAERERRDERIRELLAYTEETVDALAAQDPIVTYHSDHAFRNVDTSGWILPVSWHQVAAWRASERTGARVRYRES